ncbi:MAG: hypothetical protein ABIK44_01830 [candidate division WOR-3 bacterium]
MNLQTKMLGCVYAFVDTYRDYYTQTTPVGSISFIGVTRVGTWGESCELERYFCNHLFQPTSPSDIVPTQGMALALAKVTGNYGPSGGLYRWTNGLGMNLFGSSETELWVNIPAGMSVEHPAIIPQGVPVLFEVRVFALGFPLPNTRVCLCKPDDVYQISTTDGNGIAVFEVLAQTPGILKVTCVYSRKATTSYAQYLPSQTECEVVPTGQGGQGAVAEIPLTLECNSSNPARGAVAFTCGIPKPSRVSVLVFDAAGKKVAELFNGEFATGWHRLVWNPGKMAVGSYWVVLSANGENRNQKLVIGR